MRQYLDILLYALCVSIQKCPKIYVDLLGKYCQYLEMNIDTFYSTLVYYSLYIVHINFTIHSITNVHYEIQISRDIYSRSYPISGIKAITEKSIPLIFDR